MAMVAGATYSPHFARDECECQHGKTAACRGGGRFANVNGIFFPMKNYLILLLCLLAGIVVGTLMFLMHDVIPGLHILNTPGMFLGRMIFFVDARFAVYRLSALAVIAPLLPGAEMTASGAAMFLGIELQWILIALAIGWWIIRRHEKARRRRRMVRFR